MTRAIILGSIAGVYCSCGMLLLLFLGKTFMPLQLFSSAPANQLISPVETKIFIVKILYAIITKIKEKL